jgi:hypothetical protein
MTSHIRHPIASLQAGDRHPITQQQQDSPSNLRLTMHIDEATVFENGSSNHESVYAVVAMSR